MKLLLDTHIWLWSVGRNSRISERVREELRSPQNELWLSPISVWEALLLHSKRRVFLHDDVRLWIANSTINMHEAPLTQEIALAAHELRSARPDPADRFIAATAKVLGLTLVTADRQLLEMEEIPTFPNT